MNIAHHRILRSLLVIAAMNMAAIAYGQVSAFGLTLGQPLEILECPKSSSSPWPDLCYFPGPMTISAGESRTDHQLAFGPGQLPPWVKSARISVNQDNVLSEVFIVTNGFTVQDDVLKIAIERYGKPKSLTSRNVYSPSLGNLKTIHADWSIGPHEVHFSGALSRHDEGILQISLAKRQSAPSGAKL